MIPQLRLRTEYSFRKAFGPVDRCINAVQAPALAITDSGCWGHVAWASACKKKGIKPIFGVELAVVNDASAREKGIDGRVTLLAQNAAGLGEIYKITSQANSKEQFYYQPRIDYAQLNQISNNCFMLIPAGIDLSKVKRAMHRVLALGPSTSVWNKQRIKEDQWSCVVVSDNLYPLPNDFAVYEVLLGSDADRRTAPSHILSEAEMRDLMPYITDEIIQNTHHIADECEAILPKAEMIHFKSNKTLLQLCQKGAKERKIDIKKEPYKSRLKRELDMIAEKKFEDYFFVISDMCREAKKTMFVGPARGSSAGSLVCYLLDITDVDPIVHDLMFERFIDVTREDLPDIDIDFPDDRRDKIIAYLAEKYGQERVGRIGTVSRYKAKSAITDVAKVLSIPAWEIDDLKGAIVERSTGDARAQFCIKDTFESLDIGKEAIRKYPGLTAAGDIENHARHSGMHAAGVIVSNDPISRYCSIDISGAAQIDKKDAEKLNILKIDALGLRTLSVLQDCLTQIKKDRQWLIDYPLDDQAAFKVLCDERFSGIFQFEGYALQSLTRHMKVREFNDIVAITSLARPGPLHSGGATEFVKRRTGETPVSFLHKLAEQFTADTYGVIVYQEQVMACGRAIGNLSWEHVSELRKAMSKSLGEEFFNKYWLMFKEGAKSHGIEEKPARDIWEKMCTFGSWAFNKSHAVSYGLLSYWCAVLKAHHPLEFAAACLRHAKDEDQTVKLLRELVTEGFKYKPADAELSGLNWEVKNGILIGGLTNIKGCGLKTAQEILATRFAGKTLKPRHRMMLSEIKTPYDEIFQATKWYKDIYANPTKHNVMSGPVVTIRSIQTDGEYRFIGMLKEKNLRDLNEYNTMIKRGGQRIETNNMFLNLVFEDDTDSIIATIGRFNYQRIGKALVETGKEGDYYLIKGDMSRGWRRVNIQQIRKLENKVY